MSGPLYVFAGGGTGGHLAPGLAVAAELRRREPDCRIRFVGSGRSVEEQMLNGTGYEFAAHDVLPLAQLRRHPLRMLRSHWKAYRAERAQLRRDRPAAVIGLGGYASVPVVLAAGREQVPVVLLEQNAVPGRANRLLARWFPICLTFEQSRENLPRRATVHVTGNPIRPEIAALHPASGTPRTAKPDAPFEGQTLLVLGGSQGSQQVNESVVCAIEELGKDALAGWRIVHQTGALGAESTRAEYERIGIDHIVQPFFDDLSEWYSSATACVARAGATTLTELAMAGIPAILIPYAHAADDHQTANAQHYADAGAAILIHPVAGPNRHNQLIESLRVLVDDVQRREELMCGMRSLAKPEAAAMVVELLMAGRNGA